MVLKLSRMSFDNLFQRFTALKWNDRLPGFVFHGGRSKHLNVWLRVPLEWAESLNKKFDDKYEGALPCKHLNVVIRSWSFHLCSNLFQLSLVIRSLTEVRLSAESNILASLLWRIWRELEYWTLHTCQHCAWGTYLSFYPMEDIPDHLNGTCRHTHADSNNSDWQIPQQHFILRLEMTDRLPLFSNVQPMYCKKI